MVLILSWANCEWNFNINFRYVPQEVNFIKPQKDYNHTIAVALVRESADK